jgi:hypothetical protein
VIQEICFNCELELLEDWHKMLFWDVAIVADDGQVWSHNYANIGLNIEPSVTVMSLEYKICNIYRRLICIHSELRLIATL